MSSFTTKKIKNKPSDPISVAITPQGASGLDSDPDILDHNLTSKDVPSNHDVLITSGAHLVAAEIDYSSFGYADFQVGIWDGSSFTHYYTKRTTPSSPGDRFLADLGVVKGDGVKAVRVIVIGRANNNNVATTSIRLSEQATVP